MVVVVMVQRQQQHQQLQQHQQQQQQQQDVLPMYALDVNVHNSQNSMPNLSSGSMLLSPGANPNDIMNNFRANATLTKGHSSQSGINYMPKQLPPTAPKPQVNIFYCFNFERLQSYC